ncbi:MAG TPA: PPC domain-containing protein [Aggregatilineaceae bacterium]|nr:PPC domain-containing protein [Aggregatilineaceae bacterium]
MLHSRISRWVALSIVAIMLAAMVPVLPQAEAAGGVMAYGDVVSGQLSNKSYFELWQFDGTKGDRVQITMTGDGQLDPYLGLIEGASEQVLVEDDDSAGNSNAMIETTLPSTGTFVIVATRYDFDLGTSQGSYDLELAGGTGPNTNTSASTTSGAGEEVQPGVFYYGALTLGQNVSGTIDNTSFAHIYDLEAEAGTQIVVAMFADSSTVDSYIIFADAEGNVLAEDDNTGMALGGTETDAAMVIPIEESGTYMVIATRAGLDKGKSSGNYVLMAVIPEEDTTQAQQDPVAEDAPDGVQYVGDMELGGSTTGSITNDIFVALYTFTGEAGETVTITMRSTDGLDAYLGLIDPNDEVIAEDDDSAGGTDAQISIRLPESGQYVVVATRNGIDAGTTVGNFSLDLLAGPPPAPEGTSGVGGFGGLPGRAFELDGETFFLRGDSNSKNPDKASPLEQFLVPDDALPGRSFEVGTETFFLSGNGKSTNPEKASPVEAFFARHAENQLPGRSFQVGGETFFLSGNGKSANPEKSSPLEAFLGK